MLFKVSDTNPFQVPAENFGIGATSGGFTLQYSADGETWTSWSQATPANENTIVCNAPKNFNWRLNGNSGDVWVAY